MAPEQADIESRVSGITQPAAFVAGLLILFGYFFLVIPEGQTTFDVANRWLVYVLRIGGLAMVAVAVWSSFGQLPALALDALVSIPVGLTMVVTAIAMWSDGGGAIQMLVHIIAGCMFTSAGLRSGRDFLLMSAAMPDDGPADVAALGPVFEDGLDDEELDQEEVVSTDIVDMPAKPRNTPRLSTSGKRYSVNDEPIRLSDFADETADQAGAEAESRRGGPSRKGASTRDAGSTGDGARNSLADFAERDDN